MARITDPMRHWKLSPMDVDGLIRKEKKPGTPENLTFKHTIPLVY